MVLTIGEIAYTQDKRFTPIHENGSEVWILKIKSPEVDDTGEYECQLSYHEDEEQRYSLAFSLKVLSKYELWDGFRARNTTRYVGTMKKQVVKVLKYGLNTSLE